MQAGQIDIHAREMKRRLWRNSWIVAVVVFILSWLYQLAAGDKVNWFTVAKAVAGTSGVLIAASFALSGFCYYFNFLDTKLGYRKYLGLIGFYAALVYAISLVWLYPELYGIGLWLRLSEPEVVLGLAAMIIFAVMAIISNTKMMLLLGTQRWRYLLRLGYVAMLLLVWRAYILEGDLWLAWLSSPRGLPPARLVLSIIDLGVIGMRASMIISHYFRASAREHVNKAATTYPQFSVKVAIWFAIAVILAISLVYTIYAYFTIRPVMTPVVGVQTQPPTAVESSTGVIKEKLTSDASLAYLKLPAGFVINVFAAQLGSQLLARPGPGVGPRLMTVINDNVFVAVPGRGAVWVLRDQDGDGRADWRQEFITELRRPHNLAYLAPWYYVAAEDGVYRVKDDDGDWQADLTTLTKIVDLPTGGHWTRTVKIIKNKLFVSVGSSCNVCYEADERRAAIMRCDLDGSACRIYAAGLRNTVDFVEHDGQIYGTDNGRDNLGNLLPPEEVNLIVEGGNYGWPVCYGQKIHDADFDEKVYVRDPCLNTIAPLVELPAHNAPLGLTFYEGRDFPVDYKGDLLVAAHGSWNRQPPDGYKIFRIDWETKQVYDFISGWLGSAVVRGRPVGIVNYQNGLLVSDDAAGLIYLVRYSAP